MNSSYKTLALRSCEGAYINYFTSPEALARTVLGLVKEAEQHVAVRRHKFKRKFAGYLQKSDHLTFGGDKWELLGHGLYGEAWVHKDYPSLVVKMSGHAEWGEMRARMLYETAKDAYPVYAAFCAVTDHPNLPEILYSGRAGGLRWYIMPRYEEWDEDIHGAECPVTGVTFDTLQIAVSDVEAHNQDWGYYNVFEHVARMCETHDFDVDLHRGNMMVNPMNGAFVVTDPFSTCG